MATPDSIDGALQLLASRMREHDGPLGTHQIRLDLRGEGGGVWTLRTSPAGVSLLTGEGEGAPTVEVVAEAAAIKPVLEGRQDGRAAFLAGGIRVRGDVLAITQLSAVLGTHRPSAAQGGGNG